ncbi:MAG: hypothetical protein E6G34_09830 [Actinobacteria bacterium]|nr:MAG: hypothetical protein E6G34_09830 [Actinomycetota bacterium]
MDSCSATTIDATIVRALFAPSITGRLGESAWCAPGALRRLHGRVGLSERSSREGSRGRPAGERGRRAGGLGQART